MRVDPRFVWVPGSDGTRSRSFLPVVKRPKESRQLKLSVLSILFRCIHPQGAGDNEGFPCRRQELPYAVTEMKSFKITRSVVTNEERSHKHSHLVGDWVRDGESR